VQELGAIQVRILRPALEVKVLDHLSISNIPKIKNSQNISLSEIMSKRMIGRKVGTPIAVQVATGGGKI
jgi:hypothetical protein